LSDNKPLAIEYYKKAISIDPDFWAAYSRICSAYVLTKQYEEAYLPCVKTIDYFTDDESLYMTLGNIYLQNNQYDRAFQFYLGAISINPGQAEAYNNLAVLCYNIKDYATSIRYLNKARSLGYAVNTEFENLIKSRMTNHGATLDHKD
jgi:tetratricopeptide (TPR) repeat protein